MRLWATHEFRPITLVRGSGCTVVDTSGKSYLDLLSGTWCNVLGYGHPCWREAAASQLQKLAHIGPPFLTDETAEALGKLSEVLPPELTRAVLLNTGSEAVELALKMARAATGADEVVILERSYYGATIHALALSEAGRSMSFLPPPCPVHRLPAPNCTHCPAGVAAACTTGFPCLDGLEALAEAVDRGERKVAAILFEPVLANGGVIVPPIGYGARLRALATRLGALLVAEEVTTGMGRTGRWFGFEHDGIVPDVLVIGKALGAGLPVAGVVTTENVEARCRGALRHVQSHQNDPFSGRIAATVISVMQEEHLVEQAAERGCDLLEGLVALQARVPAIGEVRGRGLLVGIELRPEWGEAGPLAAQRLFDAGFIADYQPHNRTFRLFPPYVIAKAEIDRFLCAFEKTLAEIAARPGDWPGGRLALPEVEHGPAQDRAIGRRLPTRGCPPNAGPCLESSSISGAAPSSKSSRGPVHPRQSTDDEGATMPQKELSVVPIGYVRAGDREFRLEIDKALAPGLKELEGFSHLNVLWWCHRCDAEEHRAVLLCDRPYKNAPVEVGVFATRSPARPNPIALSAVAILSVDVQTGVIRIASIDAEEGTPIIDLKPYQPCLDRIREFALPEWCRHWPHWSEDSAAFDWAAEFVNAR